MCIQGKASMYCPTYKIRPVFRATFLIQIDSFFIVTGKKVTFALNQIRPIRTKAWQGYRKFLFFSLNMYVHIPMHSLLKLYKCESWISNRQNHMPIWLLNAWGRVKFNSNLSPFTLNLTLNKNFCNLFFNIYCCKVKKCIAESAA